MGVLGHIRKWRTGGVFQYGATAGQVNCGAREQQPEAALQYPEEDSEGVRGWLIGQRYTVPVSQCAKWEARSYLAGASCGVYGS